MGFFKKIITDSRLPVQDAVSKAHAINAIKGAGHHLLPRDHGLRSPAYVPGGAGKAAAAPKKQTSGVNPNLPQDASSEPWSDHGKDDTAPATKIVSQSEPEPERGPEIANNMTNIAEPEHKNSQSSPDPPTQPASIEQSVSGVKTTGRNPHRDNSAQRPSAQRPSAETPMDIDTLSIQSSLTKHAATPSPQEQIRIEAIKTEHETRASAAASDAESNVPAPALNLQTAFASKLVGNQGPQNGETDHVGTAQAAVPPAHPKVAKGKPAIEDYGPSIAAPGRNSTLSDTSRPTATSPQVRIGQVNVIVEAPVASEPRSQTIRIEDLSSRLFLRSL